MFGNTIDLKYEFKKRAYKFLRIRKNLNLRDRISVEKPK